MSAQQSQAAGTPNGALVRQLTPWLVAAALALPAFAPLVAHYIGFAREGWFPTGFLMYDTPYYMANAREHFDSGAFTLTYSNPFSYDYGSPRIYFQPLTLLLGVLARFPGADPGLLFALVGFAAAVICVRIAIKLFDSFADSPTRARTAGLIAFLWGGGIVVVTATLFALLPGGPEPGPFDLSAWWWFVRTGDPVGGWWFLNFGRNLIMPTEALYHALFLGAALLIVTRRFAAALAMMAVLSISHQFTGVQLLGIVGAWAFLECVFLRSRVVPTWFLAGTAALMVLHVSYYLVFLPSFPEHRQLQEQWTLPWTLSAIQSVVAYGLVGGLAATRFRTWGRTREVLSQPANRLLLTWVAVSLALENHDLFLPRAIQPLHFTRGYSWIALFLLGLPVLTALVNRLRARQREATGSILVAVLVTVFVLDNAVWLGTQSARALGVSVSRSVILDGRKLGYGLTSDQRELLAWMNSPENRQRIVLSEDDTLGYLLTTYTPLRSWRSHYANTPWSDARLEELQRFFRDGTVVDTWRRTPALVVLRDSTRWHERVQSLAPSEMELAFVNGSYAVVRISPVPAVAFTPLRPLHREASRGTWQQGARPTPALVPRSSDATR